MRLSVPCVRRRLPEEGGGRHRRVGYGAVLRRARAQLRLRERLALAYEDGRLVIRGHEEGVLAIDGRDEIPDGLAHQVAHQLRVEIERAPLPHKVGARRQHARVDWRARRTAGAHGHKVSERVRAVAQAAQRAGSVGRRIHLAERAHELRVRRARDVAQLAADRHDRRARLLGERRAGQREGLAADGAASGRPDGVDARVDGELVRHAARQVGHAEEVGARMRLERGGRDSRERRTAEPVGALRGRRRRVVGEEARGRVGALAEIAPRKDRARGHVVPSCLKRRAGGQPIYEAPPAVARRAERGVERRRVVHDDARAVAECELEREVELRGGGEHRHAPNHAKLVPRRRRPNARPLERGRLAEVVREYGRAARPPRLAEPAKDLHTDG